jgi:hypothetical protein
MPNPFLIDKQDVLNYFVDEPLYKQYLNDLDHLEEDFFEYCFRTTMKQEYDRIRKKSIFITCLLLMWEHPGIQISLRLPLDTNLITVFFDLLNHSASYPYLHKSDTGYTLDSQLISIPHLDDKPLSELFLDQNRFAHVIVFEKYSDWIPLEVNARLLFLSID